MKSAYELVVSIDRLLHEIDLRVVLGSDEQLIAYDAHADVHDLAALLSPNPEIRATLANDYGERRRYWPPSQASAA